MPTRKVNYKEIARAKLDEQINEELEKAIDELTLFDDDLMSLVFDKNIEARTGVTSLLIFTQ